MFDKIESRDVLKAFEKEEPDSTSCLHDFRAQPIGTVTDDGELKLAIIARSVQHDSEGNLSTRDFIIVPEVMERIAKELNMSAIVLGLVNSMRGMPGVDNAALLDLLQTMSGLDVTDLVQDASSVPEPRETG